MADYFEDCMKTGTPGDLSLPQRAKMVSNWLIGDFSRLLNAANIGIDISKVKPEQLCQLLELIPRGTVSSTSAKMVFEEMFNTGKDAASIIAQRGLSQISDAKHIEIEVTTAIALNTQAVADYKAGKASALQFLVGQVMRATKGRANPKVVNELLKQKLEGG